MLDKDPPNSLFARRFGENFRTRIDVAKWLAWLSRRNRCYRYSRASHRTTKSVIPEKALHKVLEAFEGIPGALTDHVPSPTGTRDIPKKSPHGKLVPLDEWPMIIYCCVIIRRN